MSFPVLQKMTTPPWIYINGYPGVGKLTVAHALARALESRSRSARVYHNHLLIDPVGAIVERDAPEYRALRSELVCDTNSVWPHLGTYITD